MKKGFTLIELLAVIVILAIIALIATPIILNIIEDSRKQSIKSSANLYVDGLVKQIASKNMLTEFSPSACIVTNGNISCDGANLDYQVNGKKPDSGFISFASGAVSEYSLYFGDYTVIKDQNGISIIEGAPQATYTAYVLGDLVQYDPVNNSACTTGSTCYKWRVITVGDTTSDDTITLQMDHNIVNKLSWIAKADYNDDTNYGSYGNTNKGPITILKELETATEDWDNSLKLNYSYDTSSDSKNYGILSCVDGACTVAGTTLTTNLKARIITGEEVRAITLASGAASGSLADYWVRRTINDYYFSNEGKIIGTDSNGTGSTSLAWLIENTREYATSGSTANAYGDSNEGYWTLSSNGADSCFAWAVYFLGEVYMDKVDYDRYYGVRPVITISKNVLN